MKQMNPIGDKYYWMEEYRKLEDVKDDLLEACKEVINWAETATPTRLIQEFDIVAKKIKQTIAKAEDKE